MPSLRVWTRVFVICLAVIALSFGGAYAAGWRIGEIDPLTGKLAKHGREIHEGILFAVEEFNRTSTDKIELISRDDMSQPQVALAKVEELIAKHRVVGLVGGYVDSLVAPIALRAKAHRVPYVGSASIQKGLTETENPYFFRVSELSGFVDPIAGFITRRLKPERIGLIHASTPGSTEFAHDLKDRLTGAGLKVVIFEKFRPGLPSFLPLISKMEDADVDMVVSGGFFPDHTLFIRQTREEGALFKGYLGPWGIAYKSFIEQMGADANNLFTTAAWLPEAPLPEARELSEKFVKGFTIRFGKEPTTTNMHGYASCVALIRAIEAAAKGPGEVTREDVRRELERLDIITPMGRVKFDKNGDPLYYRHLVVQIQNGAFEVVFPEARATSKPVYPMPERGER